MHKTKINVFPNQLYKLNFNKVIYAKSKESITIIFSPTKGFVCSHSSKAIHSLSIYNVDSAPYTSNQVKIIQYVCKEII